jgi:Flp pilus assembly pilin Flp
VAEAECVEPVVAVTLRGPGVAGAPENTPVDDGRAGVDRAAGSELPERDPAKTRPRREQPLGESSRQIEPPSLDHSDWFEFAKANIRKQEGQTMAEYVVVLAVITLGIVATLVLLSGGINGALNNVKDVL